MPPDAAIAAWQPGTHPGFTTLAEPGAPAWFELHTRDHAAAIRFYEGVFGWDTTVVSDSDEFRYSTFGEEDDALAGVMDRSADLAEGEQHWAVYFQVEDSDAAVAQVVELGGSVLEPPVDTPYGRLARVADPTGAAFRLIAG